MKLVRRSRAADRAISKLALVPMTDGVVLHDNLRRGETVEPQMLSDVRDREVVGREHLAW